MATALPFYNPFVDGPNPPPNPDVNGITLSDDLSNPTVPEQGAFGLAWDTVTQKWFRIPGSVPKGLLVQLSDNAVDATIVGGTVNIPPGLATEATLSSIDGKIVTCDTNAIDGTVTQVPRSSGGLANFHLISAASTNPSIVSAVPSQLYGWYVYNSNAAPRKLAFHDSAILPVAGVAVFFTLTLPSFSAANIHLNSGISFANGIAITTVADLDDGGVTPVGLNDLTINLWYK